MYNSGTETLLVARSLTSGTAINNDITGPSNNNN